MKQYKQLLKLVLEKGTMHENRTGVNASNNKSQKDS